MKIAILTWTHTSNFGTALQAYALQAYLKKLGHEVVLIDYNGNNNRNSQEALEHETVVPLVWPR